MSQNAVRPHVLLLPGNMCDARLWQGDEHVIPKTIQEFDLGQIYLDFEDDASIAHMAKRALGSCTGPLILIGFSMGGIVALEMARIAPERVMGLGLIDTTASPDTKGQARLRQQKDVMAGYLERVVIDELKPHYLAQCHRDDPKMLDLLRDMALKLGPDVFVAQSEALRMRADLTPILSTLNVPTFVACGAEDDLCSPAIHQAIANQIRHSTFVSVPQAGHLLPLEQPTALAKLISDFLSIKPGWPHD